MVGDLVEYSIENGQMGFGNITDDVGNGIIDDFLDFIGDSLTMLGENQFVIVFCGFFRFVSYVSCGAKLAGQSGNECFVNGTVLCQFRGGHTIRCASQTDQIHQMHTSQTELFKVFGLVFLQVFRYLINGKRKTSILV